VPASQVPQTSCAATGIAVYGAVLATLVFIWNVCRWWRDQGRLKVHCFIGRRFNGGYLPVDDSTSLTVPTHLIYTVTNIGTRPIAVRLLGGSHRKWDGWRPKSWDFGTPSNEVPTTLQPTDYFTAKNDDFLNLGTITALTAIDSLNKHYEAPWKDLRKVRRIISRLRRQAR
jgi:hypothetical protein